jgi:hypothetical protein
MNVTNGTALQYSTLLCISEKKYSTGKYVVPLETSTKERNTIEVLNHCKFLLTCAQGFFLQFAHAQNMSIEHQRGGGSLPDIELRLTFCIAHKYEYEFLKRRGPGATI